MWLFLGQGLNLSHSRGHLGPLIHCAGPGIEPVFWCYRDTANPIAPLQELLSSFFFLNLIRFLLNKPSTKTPYLWLVGRLVSVFFLTAQIVHSIFVSLCLLVPWPQMDFKIVRKMPRFDEIYILNFLMFLMLRN